MIDDELCDVMCQGEQSYDDEVIYFAEGNVESLWHKEQCHQSRIVGETAA